MNGHGFLARSFLALLTLSCAAVAQTPPACQLPPGTTIDSMESVSQWTTWSGSGAVSVSLSAAPGCTGQGALLTYNLGTQKGAWVQLRRDFNPPLDLSGSDHLRFFYRGTMPNTIEIGMVDMAGQLYFASSWNEATGISWCNPGTWDLKDFRLNGIVSFPDLSHVQAIFISVTNSANGVGGTGTFLVDELQGLNLASRTVTKPQSYQPDTTATSRAAAWIAARQQPNGLLKSWQEETGDFSWVYDQALGLLVLMQTDRAKADALAAQVIALQNTDGSWYQGYHYLSATPINTLTDIGPIAWTVYALTRYAILTPDPNAAAQAQNSAVLGSQWIARQQGPSGSVSSIAEWNLDSWWAMRSGGLTDAANLMKNFLTTQLWDPVVGRFKSDVYARQIFLDDQTWGAPLLQAIGQDTAAMQALSYGRATLAVQSTTTGFGAVCGLDGAGPFGVWNEGALQYITARGQYSQFFYSQMLLQQAADGGMPGTPLDSELRAYIVWLTPWHGIAPTAWFYFAGAGTPFAPRLNTVNASSLLGSTLATGSLANGYGTKLAGGVTSTPDGHPQPSLGGTAVTLLDSLGVEWNAGLYVVSPGKINMVLPAAPALGPATVTVRKGPLIVTQGTVNLVSVAPGISAANGNGKGAASGSAIRILAAGGRVTTPLAVYDSQQNMYVPNPISLGSPGDRTFLVLTGTGIRNALSVSATVGSGTAPVRSFGPQSQREGLDQVVLGVPRTLAGAGTVNVVVTADGVSSNPVTATFQ